jgi:hypothetical protein
MGKRQPTEEIERCRGNPMGNGMIKRQPPEEMEWCRRNPLGWSGVVTA